MKQNILLNVPKEWEKEWQGMPEYNNPKLKEPLITFTVKFENKKDYIKFHTLLKKYIYNGKRILDGMQKENKKFAWYPSKLGKKDRYIYE
jgi:phosphoribosylaminoimidazole-succinocarboxamide synthase